MTETVHTSCHCGAVELRATLSETLDQARRCDCSYCRRRAAPVVSAPLDKLKVLKGRDALTLYEFGTHTAQHYFCATCGIYMFHKRRSNPNEFGINLGTIDGVNPADYEPIVWNDGVNHPSDR